MFMEETSERDILALVSMIDEPDPDVFQEISEKILQCGDDAMPYLEDAWERFPEEDMRLRLDALKQQIRFETLFEQLTTWAKEDSSNLLNAWLDITAFFRPDINKESVMSNITNIRKDIWLEMNENLTALEQVKVFNNIFYDIHSFKGNLDDYHNPDNSFIDRVLEKRTGNPLSISIIYMLVAQSVDLPIMGINLPEHFVLAYMGERFDTESMKIHFDQPLFYINAFSGGAVFSSKEINDFLLKLGMEPMPDFFVPCSHTDIVIRMLNNLLIAYEQSDQVQIVPWLKKLRDRLEQL
jgi:regulator of sirC expression with transglutaminase-like and TPR domain